MRSYPLARTLRALLAAAALFALLSPALVQAQGRRITFAGLPWGLSADSVRPRLEALGWRFTRTSEHGDLVFHLDSAAIQAVIAEGRLVQVTVVHPTSTAGREARLRFLTDSLASIHGPPSTTTQNGAAWGGALTSLAATSTVLQDGASAAVTLVYLGGTGAERERERRAGRPGPFPGLADGWVELARSSDRRMSADTTAIVALGERVYRVRLRFDLLEPQTSGGQAYDGVTYDRDHDCARRRMRVRNLVLLLHGQPVSRVGDGGWDRAPAGTSQGMELDLACDVALEYLGP